MPVTLTDKRITLLVIEQVQIGAALNALIDVDSNDVAFDPQFATLTAQGTTQLHEKQRLNNFRVNISNQVLQLALAKAALGMPTTGITGVAERYGYDGSFNAQDFVLILTYKGTDLATGLEVTLKQTFHKMQPSSYLPFGGAPAQSVPTNTTTLVAKQTLTDLAGAAIAGLKNTLKGDYFSLDVLSAA